MEVKLQSIKIVELCGLNKYYCEWRAPTALVASRLPRTVLRLGLNISVTVLAKSKNNLLNAILLFI
jgi:hypothetical protein